MVLRTFFDRNNTLIYNLKTNVGRNPIAQLTYGGIFKGVNYSRFIFQFDETRIKELYDDKTFSDISKLKHTLRMTNTGAFDTNLLGKTTCDGKRRACSFDLVLFPIDQMWDEGVGYDYVECAYDGNGGQSSFCPSNWFYAQTNVPWSGNTGIFSGTSVVLGTQHFEQGNENLEIDITDIVNGYLTGDTNNGLGLAFDSTLEALSTVEAYHVGFFTRHTQTFYEPHVETIYSDPIKDDRADFYLDKPNKLYLYTNLGGEPTNLDNIPSVTIYDNNDGVVSTIPSSGVTQVTKGVYCVEVNIPSSIDYTDCTQFTDVWSDININGVARPDVELDFIVKDSDGYYNLGANDGLPKQVGVTISGIKSDERINRGDIRKVFVSTRIPYTINQKQRLDSLKYRLYVKEGRNEFTVIDYQDVNVANNYNYFLLDTASLVPGTYYLDIKTESNQEVSTIKDVINFDITSQVDLRNSQ